MMKIPSLGHVMLNVSQLEASVSFYCRVLLLTEVARNPHLGMVFLSFGSNDHDVVMRQAAVGATPYLETVAGLRQLAFKVGDALDDLRAFRAHLAACGVPIQRIDEHVAITSIYFRD